MYLKKLCLYFNVVNIVKLVYFKIMDCRLLILKLYIFIIYKFIEYFVGLKFCFVIIYLS